MILTFKTLQYGNDLCIDHADIMSIQSVDLIKDVNGPYVWMKDKPELKFKMTEYDADACSRILVAKNGATQNYVIRETPDEIKKAIQRGKNAH